MRPGLAASPVMLMCIPACATALIPRPLPASQPDVNAKEMQNHGSMHSCQGRVTERRSAGERRRAAADHQAQMAGSCTLPGGA